MELLFTMYLNSCIPPKTYNNLYTLVVYVSGYQLDGFFQNSMLRKIDFTFVVAVLNMPSSRRLIMSITFFGAISCVFSRCIKNL